MKHSYLKIATLVCLSLLSSNLLAQSSAKLSGSIIGTKYSVDYSTGNQSTTVNNKANVFDGDFNTFFASYDRSNTWVGLDLGTPHVITKVGWSPRAHDQGPGRSVLALFEGANDPNFLDAVPLFMNTEASAINKMHYADVNVSRGFRYVRYVGTNDSRCYLAELEFYGYEGVGDDSKFYQITNLPTVSIHTYNGRNPQSKGQDFESNVCIIYDEGTLIQEYPVLTRVRGNASAGFEKKPYRIKFNDGKSHRMMKDGKLESPAKAKKWTLINNYGDKSLMRNIMAFELSRRLQAPYTVWCQPVDVIMNGEYQGCYQLCDQITIDPNRVPITEMEPSDTEDPLITGGYLIEVDAYAHNEPSQSWFTSSRGTPVTIKEPDEDGIVPAQYNYIKNFFSQMENKVFASDYTDEVNGYRSMLDLESFLKHFVVGEFSGNMDTYWSVFMYKDRNENIFHVAPCWDFDLAFENDQRIYPINGHSNWIYNSGSAAGQMKSFVTRILNDPKAFQDLRTMWKKLRDNGSFSKESLFAYVDSTAQVLDQSQQLNFTRWKILSKVVHQNPRVPATYAEEIKFLKDYIGKRIEWIDEKLMYKEGPIDDGYGKTFEIASAADLVDFAKNVSNGMVFANAKLTADLNLLAYRSRLVPIGSVVFPYRGTFDGQGHVLKNVGCMMFGTTEGATIKNIGLESGTIVQNVSYAEHTGTLVGSCQGNTPTTISNCYSKVNLSSASNDAGGLVGKLYGTLSDSYYSGIIRVSGTVGGLIGSSVSASKPASVDHCYVSSSIVKTSGNAANRGALAGYLHSGSQMFRCFSLEGLDNLVGTKKGVTSLCMERSADLFATGSVCWLLNDNTSTTPTWFQHLGEDKFPLLDESHGIVSYKNGEYTNLDGNSIEEIVPESSLMVDVYDISGRLVRKSVPSNRALYGLPHGIYVVNGVKVVL